MTINVPFDGIYNSNELTFEVDDYMQPKVVTNLEQIARRIQNLVLMKKGTMPNNYDMGVDINSYRMEYKNENTLSAIRTEVSNQIAKYLPGIPTNTMEIIFKHEDYATLVYIGFDFKDTIIAKNVILQFELNKTSQSSRVISEIYIV